MTALVTSTVLAALGTPNEWPYVVAAYLVVFVGLTAFTARTILLSRKVGSKLPSEKRRWM